MSDSIIRDLDEHLADMDKQQERQELIENKQQEVYDDLVAGKIIYVGDNNYSMDDFIADVDVDSTYFCTFMRGNGQDMRDQMMDNLNDFAEIIAIEIIDGGCNE